MFGLANKGHAGIVWNIQPLVTIRSPGIAVEEIAQQVGSLRRSGRPEAEGAIDVDPSSRFPSTGTDLRGGIEGSRIHVARLNTDNRAIVENGHGISTHAALIVG